MTNAAKRLRLSAALTLSVISSACVYLAPLSITDTGDVAGAAQEDAAVSLDGRYVVFTTEAALVAADHNAVADVYRIDASTKALTLISVTPGGDAGNGPSGQPSISHDGETVAYSSTATNLGPTVNGISQIYVRHITAGVNVLASGTGSGAGNGASDNATLSANGTTLAFESLATNLDPSDNNGLSDIYRYQLSPSHLSWVSRAISGGATDGASYEASINNDGSSISFTSDATDLIGSDGNASADIFLSTAGAISRLSEGPSGEADGDSGQSSIAAFTGHVAFASDATNLIASDLNGVTDVFLHEPNGTLNRITQKNGYGFVGASSAPVISADGKRIGLQAQGADIGSGSGLVATVHDVVAGTFTALSAKKIDQPASPATNVVLSGNGNYSSFITAESLVGKDSNAAPDMYLRFAYRGMVWPWALSPGLVQPGTVTPITLTGLDFPVSGPAPRLQALSAPNITFTDLTVVDAFTITADMTVPIGAVETTYQFLLEFPGEGPGKNAGIARTRHVLTVAQPDALADFTDISAAAGFPGSDDFSAGLHRADLNDDGFQDVLFITHGPTEEALYFGDGTAVTPVPVMTSADRHDCDSADVDGDLRTDIYCSVGAGKGSNIGENGLFLQQPNGSFIDVAAAWGVTDPYGRGREVAFLHANNDGLPDLFVSNSGPREDERASKNQLFLNRAGSAFTPAPEFGVDEEVPSRCALSVDFDDDGDDDLVVCAQDHLRMYANQAGAGFIEVSSALGLNEKMLDVDFADIDGDGDLDLVAAKANSFVVYRLDNGAYEETVYTLAAGNPRTVAFGDFDGDADPDVFFVQRGCRSDEELNLPDFAARNNAGVFTALSVPPMTRGCGDKVAIFDHDEDGKDGILVGNGRGRRGPLQYFVIP